MTLKTTRRTVLRTGAAGLALGLAAPAYLRAQGAPLKIGHLSPTTGFLGPLGEYAQMGIKLAVEHINANGGAGGNGRVCINNSVAQEGTDGFDSPAGVNGGNYTPNNVGNPGSGANGTEPDGADGIPQALQFDVANGKWAPTYDVLAASGADGNHGRGGGGGSGSGCAPIFSGSSIGGGGGSGASGGCGGEGGGAGQYGGGSFGLFLINSTGLSVSHLSITTSSGGDGGAGVDGAPGGLGGTRGGFPGPPQGQAAGQGGAGGRASDGGAGGHGAGGPGGPSIGVYCHQSDVALDSASQVMPGQGGLGGPSSGAEGLSGLSTATYLCPTR